MPARAPISYLPTHSDVFFVSGKQSCDKLSTDSQLVKQAELEKLFILKYLLLFNIIFKMYCKEKKYLFSSFKLCYIVLKNMTNWMYCFFLKAVHAKILKPVLKINTENGISKTEVLFFLAGGGGCGVHVHYIEWKKQI